jgi:signal transduction histidine kinase
MKSMMKILLRYVASAAGVALILMVLNLTVLAVWIIYSGRVMGTEHHISEIANSLSKKNGGYELSQAGRKAMDERYQWAMLLDDNGAVIWSKSLPGDVPLKFTVPEVASFTRWYLNDYPVYTWRHRDGLLVLGSPKGSAWKQSMEMPEAVVKNVPAWLTGALIINCIASVLLALLFGVRLLRSLRPIVNGIEDMAGKRPVDLPTGGLLGNLAAVLNHASAQLARQEAALQKRDNARTAWIAGVSHDIRTPLSIATGYASQLEDNTDLPRTEREQAGIILRQCKRIKALVNNLNLASKLEYDMQPLRAVSICPAALVRGIVADFLNSGLDVCYSIRTKVEKDAQSAVLTGDEELLRRAVSNLINNSIRHNPDGCIVEVTVEKSPDYCSITVSDNGAGFPPEVLETLNSPESPSEMRSHGLGLTIVRQIVKAHGGSTEFHNLPGGGCAAVLRLNGAEGRFLRATPPES